MTSSEQILALGESTKHFGEAAQPVEHLLMAHRRNRSRGDQFRRLISVEHFTSSVIDWRILTQKLRLA